MNSRLFPRSTFILFAALGALAFSPPTRAAKVKSSAFPNRSIFGIEMAGTDLGFYGRADRVLSVSFQEYTTGPLVVSEVVIDLEGANQLLRLYSARPVSPEEMARRSYEGVAAGAAEGTDMAPPPAEILPSAGVATAKLEAGGRAAVEKFNAGLVVKTYPVTTHAKTAEFSVSSRKELLAFYKSFQSLCTNKPVAVKADGSPGAGGAGETQVLSLGGTLFTLE